MASKLHVARVEGGPTANDPRSDVRAEKKGESLLSKFEINMIKEFREKIAQIPTTSEERCLDSLRKFEGPDKVTSKVVGKSILVYDDRGFFPKENTKSHFVPVRNYLKRLFETRIEIIFRQPRATWDKVDP